MWIGNAVLLMLMFRLWVVVTELVAGALLLRRVNANVPADG